MTDEKKKELHYEITHRKIHINIIISALILVIGVILIALGFNEPLYTSNEILYKIFETISLFGTENIYITVFCIFFFGIDKKFAKKLLIGFLITLHLRDLFKNMFQDPRPLTNIVEGEPIETSFGFPSGHAITAMSFYGYTYYNFKEDETKRRIPIQILAIFLMITVPLSRLIIGVHDLQDVVGGFLIGFLGLTAYMYFEPKLSSIYRRWSLNKKILVGLAFSLGIWILSSLILYLIIPDWIALKDSIRDLGMSCGLLMGASICFPIEEKYIKFDPNRLSILHRFLAILIALVITFGVYFGLGYLFDLAPDIYYITRGFKYCIFITISLLSVSYLLNIIFKNKMI
jgi:membrane-associated phospholipid phosphatase